MYNWNFSKNRKEQKEGSGKFVLRFDDSNPETCKQEYVDYIKEDLALMNIVPDDVYFMSDFFNVVLDHCTELIERGLAYVETGDQESIKQSRVDRKPSESSRQSLAVNLQLWQDMKEGKNNHVVRLRIDMGSNNGAMRDPVIFKVNTEAVHYRTGKRYKVYPLFDFISPIVDSLNGVTHVMRTTEFTDKIPLHKWILEELGMKFPAYKTFSRMNLKGTVLSKRKLREIINGNAELSWDHPIIPTVRGMYNRGYKMEAFMEYFRTNMSFKSGYAVDDWDTILKINRNLIDKSCHKMFAIKTDNNVRLEISHAGEGGDEVDVGRVSGPVAINMKNKGLGERTAYYPTETSDVLIDRRDYEELKQDDKVLLLMWKTYQFAPGGLKIFTGEVDLKSVYKMSWIVPECAVKVTALFCNPLIDEETGHVNDVLYESRELLVENHILNMKVGDTIQLYRMGFFRIWRMDERRKTDVVLVFVDEPGGAKQFLNY